MTLHAIGFGSLNLDEFWEVSGEFMRRYGLKPGEECQCGVDWFREVYPILQSEGSLKSVDPGGSAANMIACLRRMGYRTGFYGAAGKADLNLLRLSELGDAQNLRISESDLPSGRCLALIDRDDPERDRALAILPNANDLAGSMEADQGYFDQARWVHMTSFVSDGPLTAQIRLAERLGEQAGISFDPGVLYCLKGAEALKPILRKTEILFATQEELQMLYPDIREGIEALFDLGVGTIVVKRGSKGLTAWQSGVSYDMPATPAPSITDRTGAGDVAAAGFLAGRLRNLDIIGCIRLSSEAASKSLQGYGRSSYPDKDFLDAWLRENTERDGDKSAT